jgi:Lrp/AsnC family transcriptional regulator for asnA, asnC and gidA
MSKIDKIDYNIVDLLMQDGRMPAAEIARRIGHGVSERAVRYRIERLVQDGLIRISAIPNPRALGYQVIADVFIEVEAGYISDVAHQLTEYECISYVACSIGETDVSAQVISHDTTEVYRFITEVIGKIPGVRKTTTSIVPVILRDVYSWHIPTSQCMEE